MDKLKEYILLLLHLSLAITYVNCDGQMAILKKPSSLKVLEGDQMDTRAIFSSIEHLLGFQHAGAKQMELMNVFEYENLNVIVLVVNPADFDTYSSNAMNKYRMIGDWSVNDLVAHLMNLNTEKNVFEKNIVVEPWTENQSFDANNENPRVVVADLRSSPENPKIVPELMSSISKSPDVEGLMIVISGETTPLIYDREKRQLPAEESNVPKKEVVNAKTLNLADDYDEDFPVIFNIMLWFSLALIFALISICMVIANMDPGRDSIIYRMTSTRMKKDN